MEWRSACHINSDVILSLCAAFALTSLLCKSDVKFWTGPSGVMLFTIVKRLSVHFAGRNLLISLAKFPSRLMARSCVWDILMANQWRQWCNLVNLSYWAQHCIPLTLPYRIPCTLASARILWLPRCLGTLFSLPRTIFLLHLNGWFLMPPARRLQPRIDFMASFRSPILSHWMKIVHQPLSVLEIRLFSL